MWLASGRLRQLDFFTKRNAKATNPSSVYYVCGNVNPTHLFKVSGFCFKIRRFIHAEINDFFMILEHVYYIHIIMPIKKHVVQMFFFINYSSLH
jgi:hypothetical protein